MRKVVSLLAILVILLSILTQTVYAASSFRFSATPNATTVKKGDTVKISLRLSDINAGEKGINTFECILKYDEKMFESVKIETKNNWSITYNDEKSNANYGKLLAVLLATGIKEDQEIGTIILKVKKNTNVKSGTVSFTDVSSNDGQNMIKTSNKIVTIKVKDSSSNGNNDSNNGATTKPIPQTGDNHYFIIVGMICMIAISTIAYSKFTKYDK